jgi:hypothetical protein
MSRTRHCLAIVALVSAVTVLDGCAVREITNKATPDEEQKIEKTHAFSAGYDAVWAETLKTLVLNGVSIQSQDKSSGNISTDWKVQKEAIGVFTTGRRFRLNIIVEKLSPNATRVTLVPAFETRVADKANWKPTSRPAEDVTLEKSYFDAIEAGLRKH